jgi:hypothetical protein
MICTKWYDAVKKKIWYDAVVYFNTIYNLGLILPIKIYFTG